MQGFDTGELAGLPSSSDSCKGYSTLGDFGASTTVGGYRKASTFRASPCGYAMKARFNGNLDTEVDGFVVVDSSANVLQMLPIANLTDPFYSGNLFMRASNYLFTQWLDVEDPNFVSWITRPSTNTKLMLVGGIKASLIPPGNYSVVIYNNFQTNSSKKLLIKTANSLGTNNYVLGFSLLAYCKPIAYRSHTSVPVRHLPLLPKKELLQPVIVHP